MRPRLRHLFVHAAFDCSRDPFEIWDGAQARDTFGNAAAADIGDSPFAISAQDSLLEDIAVSVAVTKVSPVAVETLKTI